jgi:hypothetical protein
MRRLLRKKSGCPQFKENESFATKKTVATTWQNVAITVVRPTADQKHWRSVALHTLVHEPVQGIQYDARVWHRDGLVLLDWPAQSRGHRRDFLLAGGSLNEDCTLNFVYT